jgi:hypothetical protein
MKLLKCILALSFSLIAVSVLDVKGASAVEDRIYQKGSFTSQVGTQTIYPNTYNLTYDLYFNIKSTSAASGDYMVYLQRPVEGNWVTVSHFGVPRNGQKVINPASEYGGRSLYQYTPYRFLLKNDNGISINYEITAY